MLKKIFATFLFFFLLGSNVLRSQEFLDQRDVHTNQLFTYKKKVLKLNNVPIKDSDVDNVLIIKVKGNYYERVYDEGVSVKWFGAKGDGIADDTQAIQKAINAVSNLYPIINMTGGNWQGGGKVYLPKGKYKITKTLVLKHAISLVGESRTASQIHCENPIIAITNIYGMEGSNVLMANSITIKDLLITQGTVELQGAYNSLVENCTIMNLFGSAPNAIIIRLSVALRIQNVKVYNVSGVGILFEDTAGSGPSTTVLLDNVWASHCNVGLLINGNTGGSHEIITTNIINSIFEYNKTGVVLKGNLSNISFRNIHFEQNSVASIETKDTFKNIVLDNVWCDPVGDINVNGTTASSISISNSKCTVASNKFSGKLMNQK